MCAFDELLVVAKAREVAEELLGGFGVPLAKAIEVSTPAGFDRAVARFAAALRQVAALPEAEAVRRAVAVLDVDWRAMTPARRNELVAAALHAAGRALRPVPRRIEVPLGRMAAEVASATRSHARRRQRLAIGADFNALDHRAVAHVRRSQVLYVTDEYGRRLASLEQRARSIVADGLEHGLGRADIAEDLAEMAAKQLVGRSRSYWELVASAFVGEGRALSQVSAYAEAGIERYVLHAVLDEATTNACRMIHGKVLETAHALRTFERLERARTPELLKQERPWVRERVGADGKRELYVSRGKQETVLAVVERSGVGVLDDIGDYSRVLSGGELAPAGLGFPPFHGHCRTTTIPES